MKKLKPRPKGKPRPKAKARPTKAPPQSEPAPHPFSHWPASQGARITSMSAASK